MFWKNKVPFLLAAVLFSLAASDLVAQDQKPIALPAPQITGGKPLMQALSERKTTRAFREASLSPQTLSNLLWAAFGVNRPDSVKKGTGRTAPSAMNRQEVQLYVVLAQGAYLYNAQANQLQPVATGDLRAKVGSDAAAHAAVTLIYAADAKFDFAQVDVGFIGQNVYLFAASEGLNAWFYALHGPQDSASVAAALKLPGNVHALYGQSVGFPPQ